MREILFRGKKINKPWAYGHLFREREIPSDFSENHWDTYFIIDDCHRINPVDPFTIGEFIGLIDYHGNKIFEGDIVRTSNKSLQGIIVYNINTCSYVIANKEIIDSLTMYEDIEPFADDLEVIGNFTDGIFIKEEQDAAKD